MTENLRTMRNVSEALRESVCMLRVISHGGSYDSADYLARLRKIEGFLNLSPSGEEELATLVGFDLQQSRTKTGRGAR
jgi:hypothetical protein